MNGKNIEPHKWGIKLIAEKTNFQTQTLAKSKKHA